MCGRMCEYIHCFLYVLPRKIAQLSSAYAMTKAIKIFETSHRVYKSQK